VASHASHVEFRWRGFAWNCWSIPHNRLLEEPLLNYDYVSRRPPFIVIEHPEDDANTTARVGAIWLQRRQTLVSMRYKV